MNASTPSAAPLRRPLTPAYGLVLLVWMALFLVRPALALQILRERRADSPLPRLAPWARGLSVTA